MFDYVVKRYVEDPSGKTHGQLISEIYTRLNQQQRNEYFYMNTLLNKLLCGIHNVNTTVAFSQVRIEHSIADFVMINGEGRVYEIKSDLDNFSRLHNQLQDYFCAFNKVSVLASIHEQEKVRDVLSSFGEMGEAVGIYVLSEQGTIFSKERSKEPVEYNANLRHSSIFKLLRKKEYESLSANTKIFRDIANEIAKPLRRNDSALAYLPTQFITEFIKSNGYAGVAYTSTMRTEGINVAVFDESIFECVAVHTVEINNISY